MPSKDRGGGRSKLRFSLGEIRVTIRLPEEVGRGPTMFMPGWLLFSQSELAILRLLADGRPRSREEIARALDTSADGKIKGTLATLGARCCVLVTPDGYRLNLPTEQLPDIRRWLDTIEAGEET